MSFCVFGALFVIPGDKPDAVIGLGDMTFKKLFFHLGPYNMQVLLNL